ncbi:hypothetical protein ES703_42709 [subsurface metagenome]
MVAHSGYIGPAHDIDGGTEHSGGLVCPYRGTTKNVSLGNVKDKHQNQGNGKPAYYLCGPFTGGVNNSQRCSHNSRDLWLIIQKKAILCKA